eukprot:CAMPEP_0173390270 /NCGR_PEP_ID=MMETSP1356-20130122/14391_1 /TAXON_ID=77927 ORGANISM="Hemiselmis virescens, Strain PCC157" /NCGR_SAMPLE_ID=MMETSP1356 /ASSEMBLY_ACC=CAM_ASM_000847 /LENGTH=179 /DNA_ID=CAMNT_0014347611 /DNA_START=246 /DNA_END=785 /DNA_ORIENTATION=-
MPSGAAHQMQMQQAYDAAAMQHAGHGHHHGHGVMVNNLDRDGWMKSRTATPDLFPHATAPHSLQPRDYSRPPAGGDQSMSMGDSEEAELAHSGPTHSERTLDKWEHLLRTKPSDPMAFYWREMIQWCKVRGNGSTGVKRGPPPHGACVEESVEVIDRLVKKIRCDDGPIGHAAGSWARS